VLELLRNKPGEKLDYSASTSSPLYAHELCFARLRFPRQIEHPGSLMVATERGKYYMGGKVTGLNLPIRDFVCQTPKEVRSSGML
jgi:hypothetical protein